MPGAQLSRLIIGQSLFNPRPATVRAITIAVAVASPSRQDMERLSPFNFYETTVCSPSKIRVGANGIKRAKGEQDSGGALGTQWHFELLKKTHRSGWNSVTRPGSRDS